MPSHVQFQITDAEEREERKRRQEKFRKRTGSLFNKARLLAKDTDAWVALIVRDRAGRIKSFRSSDSLYWPPSVKDLIVGRRSSQFHGIPYADQDQKKKHPSGTHEFLKKYAISGCWKEVADDGSDSGSEAGGTDLFVKSVPMGVTSVETGAGSDTNETVDQCHVGRVVEVEAGANAPKSTAIETVEPQKSAVETPGELESTSAVWLRESDGITVDVPGESDYITVDALVESVNPSVDSIGEPDGKTVELGESDKMTVDAVGGSAPDVPSVQLLGDSESARDMPGQAMAMDVHDTTEVDPTLSEYDMMDLDIPGAKSRAEMETRERESIEAADALYTLSQYHSPPISGGLDSWQVVNWPMMTRQDVRQGWGSKSSTGIDPKDPKELLREGWDWVFQRR